MSDYPGEAQIWATHHRELSRSLSLLIRSIREAFQALADIQYAAPWKRRRRGCPPAVRV